MATELQEEVDHPLDPLVESEIETGVEILQSEADFSDASRIVKIVLKEPSKDTLQEYERGNQDDIEREANVIVRDSEERKTYEGVISLDDETLTSWEHIPGVQPSITLEEFDECEETVKNNSEWQEAAAKRGVENFDLAIVDPWSAGHHLVPDGIDRDQRLSRALSWIRTSEENNGYARPLSGIHTFVDLDKMEVVEVVDTGVKEEDVVDNLQDAVYREEERDLRDDLKPYNVIQPEGPSWNVNGRKVEWQNWHFRVGWTQREGLVLHNIGYEDDDGNVRSIINRASCVEMSVPYGELDPNYNWQNAFDVGEYNVGRLANSLTEGCDCLGYMNYWDAVMNDTDGNVMTIPSAICLHEEDFGLLWKHTDWRTENTEVRRNRRLVVSFIATVANYDYAFYWYFYQDGSIEAEVRLTGINLSALVAPDEDPSGFSEVVAPQLKNPIHQHFFNFRLDMDIDGRENNLYRVQNEVVPEGPNNELNPAGNAFYADRTQLTSETEAQELIDPLQGRYWQVQNPGKTNAYDRPVGYKLVPGDNVKACAQPGSSVMERAGFIDNHLWATPYKEDERFPAGDYPNQSKGDEGLPTWTNADRSLDEEDLVLWYTLGVNHITRPEDYPVLPVERAQFRLAPVNFFDENPAIDVPPEHAITDIDQWKTENQESMELADDD